MDSKFNAIMFERAIYEPRTEELEIELMAAFFPEGEKPLFTVRGLTADEVARTNKAVENGKTAEALIKALACSDQEGLVDGLKAQLGYGDAVDGEVSRRIELIIYGTVSPKLPRELIVKISNTMPTVFYLLSNKITDLTGQGQVTGKQTPSGETTECKPV